MRHELSPRAVRIAGAVLLCVTAFSFFMAGYTSYLHHSKAASPRPLTHASSK